MYNVISTQVRKAIHVGDTVYYDISNHSILVDDIPKPSTQTLKSLIEVKSYKVWSLTQLYSVDFSKSTIHVFSRAFSTKSLINIGKKTEKN